MISTLERARGLAGAFCLLLLLAGCAGSPQTRLLLDDPPDLPPRVELAEVPFFPQQEYHCGPAALAGILNYRGRKVQPEQIAELIYLPDLKGSLQVEVVAATRQFDLLPERIDGRLDALLTELSAGNPVFVLQNLGLDAVPVWHYEILIGYDFPQRQMILRSGTHERITRSFALFEKTWRRAGYWALAVVPADLVPASVDAGAFVDAAIAMEQVGRIDTARRAYRRALLRWPDNLVALGGAGNTAYAMGDFSAAENAYRDALRIDAERADIWNNLAYALAQLGRHEAALAAIERALELEPENRNFRDSFDELSSWY